MFKWPLVSRRTYEGQLYLSAVYLGALKRIAKPPVSGLDSAEDHLRYVTAQADAALQYPNR